MTLASLPLVLHERTKEAVMAGLKYLFYSVAGAFLALFGIFFLTSVCPSLDFVPGGIVDKAMIGGREGLFFGGCVLYGHRLWDKGRDVSSPWVAAYGSSGGSGSGQRRAFRRDYQIRRAGSGAGGILYRRS